MKAWIQRHDLSAENFEFADASAAKKALHDFDWATECRLQAESEDENAICDPGFGLLVGDTHILHICPHPEQMCMVHFVFPKKKKLLGFIPILREATRTWKGLPLADADHMIELLFTGDYQGLAKMNPHARID